MSRIDQAVKIWESGKAAEASALAPGFVPPAGGSPLNQYPNEAPQGNHRAAQELARPEHTRAAAVDREAASAFMPESTSLDPASPAAHHEGSRPPKARDNADLEARLVTGSSNTVSLEQYRRLAAILHEEQVQKQLKTVMVTSALPQEGKTLTVVNLALTLSESYARRVLVIDADLRWPSLHRLIGVANHAGLSEVLREGRRDLPFVEVSDRLSVLTAGHHHGKVPLAGLTSERISQVIDECAAHFEWVLIDTPPVGMLPDAQVLARLIGAVIFVIRAGSTPAAAAERAIADLGRDAVIGTVLNRVEEWRIPAASYYSEYGSQYGAR